MKAVQQQSRANIRLFNRDAVLSPKTGHPGCGGRVDVDARILRPPRNDRMGWDGMGWDGARRQGLTAKRKMHERRRGSDRRHRRHREAREKTLPGRLRQMTMATTQMRPSRPMSNPKWKP